MSSALLAVSGLTADFTTRRGPVRALEGVSFEVRAGEIAGILGESGSGKSAVALAIAGIADPAMRARAGRILIDGEEVLPQAAARARAGARHGVAMVFQHPRAAMNPIRPVLTQLADVIARHHPAGAAQTRDTARRALQEVHLPLSGARETALPHELSGGECQRAAIAIALASAPRLLIADEPTSGLDAARQEAVMDLLCGLARTRGMALLTITHDPALAARYCDRLIVMQAGQVVETGPARALHAAPRHPYTAALWRATPALARTIADLAPIPGTLPDLTRDDLPPCRFAERCPRRMPACGDAPPPLALVAPGHLVACRNPL